MNILYKMEFKVLVNKSLFDISDSHQDDGM